MAKRILLFLLSGLIGAVLAGVAAFILLGVSGKPDLKPWHTARLHEEFTQADSSRVTTLAEYTQLEDRLFGELQREVYQRVEASERNVYSRYSSGSRADPMSYPENFNRTFVLTSDAPRAGVLLIHGLTDSPYVFRALATRLHERGCTVVALRLPGHGTAASALATIHWQDWAAAVRMAMSDLRRRLPPQAPLYMMGFSTGAALSVEYSLARLEGEKTPAADALVLLSPAIGVDPLAWLAVWQERMSMLPGLGKMAWLDLIPEYDPYKYNSFPVRAGREIYEVTQTIDERLTRLSAKGPVAGFPRTLVFQSVADATVSPRAVVAHFLGRLAPEGHELVVYDRNRRADTDPFLSPGVRDGADQLLVGKAWPFGVTLVTNAAASSSELVARYRPSQGTVGADAPLGLSWPTGMFSLSHLALPVAPDDPIYGAERPRITNSVYLGKIEVLGEQGLLAIPSNALLRLRFNPFFSYEANRIEQFLRLTPETP
jgi:alpha-beta hydrolase superfamily lysophospholipase